MNKHKLLIKPIKSQQTLSLRHMVLRPHQTLEDCVYPNDDDDNSFHLGGFLDLNEEQQLIGILSVYYQPHALWPNENSQWRLRGMAILPEMQSMGYGSQLVLAAIETIQNRGGGRLWMNAREPACLFYSRLGFNKAGERFELKGIGPHWIKQRLIKPV